MPANEPKRGGALGILKLVFSPITNDFWLKALSLAIAAAIYFLLAPEKPTAKTIPPADDQGVFPLNRAGVTDTAKPGMRTK